MVYIWSLRWMYPFFFVLVCLLFLCFNKYGFRLFSKLTWAFAHKHCTFNGFVVLFKNLQARVVYKNRTLTGRLWKTIYCVQFQSYDMCSSMSTYGSLRRGGRTWRINCISNTVARFSISCVPSITRTFVWTHGILANGIDVTGMGTRGVDSNMKQTGMLVVSLRGVNFGFWSHLGCSGQSPNILSRQGLV